MVWQRHLPTTHPKANRQFLIRSLLALRSIVFEKPMKYFVCILVFALLILHQDYWQWDKSDLVFGFLPYPMAYHMVISLLTAVVWFLAITFCWPKGLDEVDELGSEKGAQE